MIKFKVKFDHLTNSSLSFCELDVYVCYLENCNVILPIAFIRKNNVS